MARIRFTVGVRYLLNGQVYCITQLLLDDRVLVENQSFGGQTTVTMSELRAAWSQGDLRFEVTGTQARKRPDQPIATDYTIADFQHLPEHYRIEAWRRYDLLKPLLTLPAETCTSAYLEQYVQSLKTQDDVTSSKNTSEPLIGKPVGLHMGMALSVSSIYRWLRDFRESGYDVRSLVPSYARSGAKGANRIEQEIEAIIQQVLAECQTSPMQRTVKDVYLIIVNRVAQENRTRPHDAQFSLPGQTTIYRRIQREGKQSILRRRRSRTEQQADNAGDAGPAPTRILERVEIDHTLLDLFLVDEEDRLPIGRPTLTYALDVFSGFPLGVCVSFEPPSYRAVMRCLLHAILPKPDAVVLYETTHTWEAYGLPEKLIIDNGPEFIGHDLDNACAHLGIILERLPVKTPWFKGSVERFFRTNNTGLIHTLPGTTFSNLLERGDYDPFKHACISLTAFWKLLHVFLLDYYAQKWHEGRECIPAKRWHADMQGGFVPALHTSAEETRLLLYPGDTRTLQRSGIDFEALRYQSPDLARLRSVLPKGTSVVLKYDPGNIRALHVLDPTTHQWLQVPAIDQAYTQGLSLWKHRLIRGYVLREKGTVDIVALAAAKQKIQQIAAEEFVLTKKGRGRKTAARFLEIGTNPQIEHTSTVPPPVSPPPPTDSSPDPVPDPPATEHDEDEDDLFDTEGWGGDYNLPRQTFPYREGD